jgi:hypothetical protein
MFGLERMVDAYLLGFALVWAGVLVACLVGEAVGRFRHNWDRAFTKELRTSVRPAGQGLPAATRPARHGE